MLLKVKVMRFHSEGHKLTICRLNRIKTSSVWPVQCSFKNVQCLPTFKNQEVAHKILASSLYRDDLAAIGMNYCVAMGAVHRIEAP